MMMCDFEIFEPEHLADFDPIEEDAQCDLREMAQYNALMGPGLTGFIDGEPVAAGGIRWRRNKSGEIWFIMKKSAKHRTKTILRSINLMLDIVIKDSGFKYVFAPSEIGFPESQRLLEHCGFKRIKTIMNGTHYYYRREVT